MIYLIQDVYEDQEGNIQKILKIGYSSKSFEEGRKSQYDTHNFGYKFLGEREGSKELESYLHRRLKDYHVSLEWFRYDPEIIRVFNEVSENDISDFISQEELNEYIRDYILTNLVPSVSKLSDLYLDSLLEELRKKSKEYPDLEYNENLLRREILEVFRFVSFREREYFLNLSFENEEVKKDLVKSSLVLSKISGRVRNIENPFKNDITIFYRTTRNANLKDKSEFLKLQEERRKSTEILLSGFSMMSEEMKKEYLQKLKSDIKVSQYSRDFVSISKHTNLPVYNTFIEVSNERAWEVSQEDYQDKINVTKAFESVTPNISEYLDENEKVAKNFLDNQFYRTNLFRDKLKMYGEFMDMHSGNKEIEDIIYFKIKDSRFRRYYNFYGTKGCSSRKYEEKYLQDGMFDATKKDELKNVIYNKFKIGDSYILKEIKEELGSIYRDLGITSKNPKATDLSQYFKLTRIKFTDPQTKKRIEGFRLDPL